MQDAFAIRKCGEWIISLQTLTDGRWKAIATQLCAGDWATGIDADEALTNLASKLGLNRHDLLRAFGLIR